MNFVLGTCREVMPLLAIFGNIQPRSQSSHTLPRPQVIRSALLTLAVGELVEEINVGDHPGIKFVSLFRQAPTQPH